MAGGEKLVMAGGENLAMACTRPCIWLCNNDAVLSSLKAERLGSGAGSVHGFARNPRPP